MRAQWKWLGALLLFGLWTDYAVAGVIHSEMQLPGSRLCMSRFERMGIDDRVERDTKLMTLAEDIRPFDLQVETKFVPVIEYLAARHVIVRVRLGTFPRLSREGAIPKEKDGFPSHTICDDRRAWRTFFLRGQPRSDSRHTASSNDLIDGQVALDRNAACGRLPGIGDIKDGSYYVPLSFEARGFAVKVRARLSFANVAGGGRCIPRLLYRFASMEGGVSGMEQRSPDQEYASAGDQGFGKADTKHPPGPFRHVFLSGQVALSALLFFGGIGLIVRGFQRAGNSLEQVLDGGRRYWLSVGGWLLLAFSGGGIAASVAIYWLSVCKVC